MFFVSVVLELLERYVTKKLRAKSLGRVEQSTLQVEYTLHSS
jgi:hypothetical protein